MYYNYLGEQSNSLMEVQIPVANQAFCKQAYLNYKPAVIDENVICAGFSYGGKDSCRVYLNIFLLYMKILNYCFSNVFRVIPEVL